MACKGSKRVEIKGLEEKRQITGVFCESMVREFLPIQLVYKGKTDRCHPSYNFPLGLGHHAQSQPLVKRGDHVTLHQQCDSTIHWSCASRSWHGSRTSCSCYFRSFQGTANGASNWAIRTAQHTVCVSASMLYRQTTTPWHIRKQSCEIIFAFGILTMVFRSSNSRNGFCCW